MTATVSGRRPRSHWLPWGCAVGAVLLLLGPALGPGYLLVRDMVFVPRPPVTGRLLGLWSETPRAVPSDAVVALLSNVLPGSLVQGGILVGLLLAAAGGAARLAGQGWPGAVAAVAAIWNPYVAERLAMGQWALLVGYAALPWVISGLAARLQSGGRWRGLALALGLGAVGGAAAMVLVGLAVVGSALAGLPSRPGRQLGRLVGPAVLFLVLCLPWAVPSLLRPRTSSDPAGFAVFAPVADTAYGVVVSVLTGGGVWNSEVVPPGRRTAAAALGGLLIVLLAVVGVGAHVRRHRGGGPVIALAVTAVLGLACTAASATPWATGLAGLPGGGLLRDGVRESGPWVLLVAVGLGLFADLMVRHAVPVLPYAALLLPVAVLPVAAWGVGGQLRPTSYPADVLAAARLVNASPTGARVVVLPFEAYRTYGWNEHRPSLTPWTRLVNRPVASSTDLVVQRGTRRTTVAGEDAWAAQVGAALTAPDPGARLRALGVGWVLVDDASGRPPAGAELVSRRPNVSLSRLHGSDRTGSDAGPRTAGAPPRGPVLAGDVVAVLALCLALRPRRRSPATLAGARPTLR